jgi:hypothetical protein
MDRDAGLRVAGHDRPLDGRGAAPAWQQRRMDVQPQPLGQNLFRDQEPVRRNDNGVRSEIHAGLRPSRLQHGDTEALRRFLGRRRPRPTAASTRRIGPGQHRGDLVIRRQPLEDIRSERRRRGDGQAH